jgi:hypothetical protein
MRKIPAAKAGNMAIPFQSEAKRNQHGGWRGRGNIWRALQEAFAFGLLKSYTDIKVSK